MRADDLLILLEVARCGSLVAAAATLRLDHTTVSRRISALERDLRQPLVIRGPTGCQLTDLGRALLAASERVESAVAEAHEHAHRPTQERSLTGLVRVAAPEALSEYVIAPVLARMHSRHPGIVTELVTTGRLPAHGTGSDIEIGVGEPLSRRADATTLCEFELGLYASDSYLAKRGMPSHLSDLVGHSFVYYINALLQVEDIKLALVDAVIPSRTVQVGSTSIHSHVAATVAGGGIGLLPAFMAGKRHELQRLLVEEGTIRLKFLTALAPRGLRRPAAVAVMREIRKEIAACRGELAPTSALPTAT